MRTAFRFLPAAMAALLLLLAGACAEAPLTADESLLTAEATTSSRLAASLWVPLAGDLDVTAGGLTETVRFEGAVHVVVDSSPLSPTDPCRCRVHTNLASLVGVGLTSGATYRATGAWMYEATTGFPSSLDLQAAYPIVPPDPIVPPNPTIPPDPVLPVAYHLSFSADGGVASVIAEIKPPIIVED